LLSNRCYAIKMYDGIISRNVQNVILDTCAKFNAPIFAPIALTLGTFYDVLAAMLDFRFSENVKVWYYIQNKCTHHHFGLILKISFFYPQNA